MDIANNVWHIAPVPPDYIDHPAPFPEEIPFRLITLYSYPNDLVLDPFAGSGQTLKVARWLNRQYVGYEIIEKYVELCRRRINEHLSLRPQQLVAVFEKNRSRGTGYIQTKEVLRKARAREQRTALSL